MDLKGPRWKRSDISPGDIFRGRNGSLWRVSGVADDPTVYLESIVDPDGGERSYVISSSLFAEQFSEKLEARKLNGS